jgi:hypothetical protein
MAILEAELTPAYAFWAVIKSNHLSGLVLLLRPRHNPKGRDHFY